MGQTKPSSKREAYSNKILLKEQEKSQIKILDLHLKQLKKKEKTEN